MAASTLRQSKNYGPALIATGVWLGVGAGLDAYLVATHKEHFITDILRTKPGMFFLTLLGLHVVDRLGPIDPFRFAAGAIANKFPLPILTDVSLDQ